MTGFLERRAAQIAVVLSLAFAALSIASSWNKTATADEPIYLAAGVRIWQTGDTTTNQISSPFLLKPWLAWPLVLAGEGFPEDDERFASTQLKDHWQAGSDFLYATGRSAAERLRLGRISNVVLAVVTGWLLFGVAWACIGRGGAVLAMAVYFGWPDVVAHARFASLDTGLTLVTLLALVCGLPLLRDHCVPAWRIVPAGVALGLALLAKTAAVTLVGFFGVAAVAVLVFRRRQSWYQRFRPAARIVLGSVVALLVVNAAFGFRGTGDALGDHPRWPEIETKFAAGSLGAVAVPVLRHAPWPLPRSYVDLLIAQAEIGSRKKPVAFGGELQRGGWWWFSPVALSMKTTLVVAAGLLLAACAWLARGRRLTAFTGGMLGYAVFLLLFLIATDRFGHVRYALPLVPLFALAAAAGWSWLAAKTRLHGLVALLVAVGVAAPHALAYPHYLSWINPLYGGPNAVSRWLVDSNSDWGQDLAIAGEVCRERGIDRVALAWFGSGRRSDFGVNDVVVLPSVGIEPDPGDSWWYDLQEPDWPNAVEGEPLRLPELPIVANATTLSGILLRPDVSPRWREVFELYRGLAAREPDVEITPVAGIYLPPHSPPAEQP